MFHELYLSKALIKNNSVFLLRGTPITSCFIVKDTINTTHGNIRFHECWVWSLNDNLLGALLGLDPAGLQWTWGAICLISQNLKRTKFIVFLLYASFLSKYFLLSVLFHSILQPLSSF